MAGVSMGEVIKNAAFLRPWLAPLGWALVLAGEWIVSGWGGAFALSMLGAAALVLLALWSLFPHSALASGPDGGRRLAALPAWLLLGGVAVYFLWRMVPDTAGGAVNWRGLLQWGWILLALHGAVLFVFLEIAGLGGQGASGTDPARVRRALLAGNGFGLLLLLLITLNFIFNRLPWEWNLAYFKVTRPSQATRELVTGLTEPVEAAVFFTADSPLAPLLRSYFDALTRDGSAPNFKVRFADAHLAPDLAHTFQAQGNGWVSWKKEGLVAKAFIGETIPRARQQLLRLDETVFSKVQEVGRKREMVYFTVGHGERNEAGHASRDPARGLGSLNALLRKQNFQVKPLGFAEGLGREIPPDAAVVVIAGPTLPFTRAEADSLRAYLERGGRLLALLEPPTAPGGGKPPARDALLPLLRDYGIGFDGRVQGNDRYFARRTRTRADHALLVTNQFQHHPSMTAFRRGRNQFALLAMDAGALQKGKAPPGFVVQETLRAMPGTWADANGNFLFDQGRETRGKPTLGLAVERLEQSPHRTPKGTPAVKPAPGVRIMAFSDVDIASDLLLRFRGNSMLMAQSMAWLANRAEKAVYPNSEKDVRILHAKDDDWLWFYLPVVGVPLLVLGFGLWRTRGLRTGGGTDHAD